MKLYKNQAGIGMAMIILAVVVIGGIAGAGIYVAQNKDKDQNNNQTNQNNKPANNTPVEPVISDRLEKEAYVNSAEGFKINVPKGWKEPKQPVEETAAFFESPDAIKIPANISVSIDPEPLDGLNLDSYTEASILGIKEATPNYKMISNDKLSVNGIDARIIENSSVDGGEQNYDYQMIIIKNEKAYIITGGVTGETKFWEANKALIRESMLTFQIN